MASVRIEDEARKDPRFVLLSKKLGTTRFDALARMVEVWAFCTEKQTHSLREEVIDVCAEFEGFGKLIASVEIDLATRLDNGLIRIRGTKGRIEWLKKLRNNGKKGGRPKKTKPKPEGNQNETKTEPPLNPLTLAPSLAPAIKSKNIYTPEFEALWQKMPEGLKQKAFKAFKAGMKKWDHKTPTQISEAISNYLADCEANNRFKMHLSSFIGSDRTTHPWLEFIEPRAAPPPPAGTLPMSLNVTCNDCRNGLIRAVSRSSGASFDLACRCAKGRPKQNAYGVFDSEKFERVTA